ncbi:tRNA(Met) cytidine acetyltransferase TmcA [Natronobeatus ordinarius]|uniref:tRNA(Met) cytidine acetyltransferase TmcA n=1 Tax=Natronobeatus ordinarius TaxID=2963433 RepID=UPI0020CD2236|nr:tRNA(Met) cytidine acetyltransferase TmcA [Natronobeatus ordinarius]
MDVVDVATGLRREATRVGERRLLVLAGGRERGYETLEVALDALDVPITRTTLVGPEDRLRCEQVPVSNAGQLLGATRDVVVVDAHESFRPNALGQVTGVVDGGGLLVALTPPLAEWPARRDGFDERLAVSPFTLEDVTGNFRERLVETLYAHPGIAIVDVDAGRVERDGLTQPAPRLPAAPIELPAERRFPAAAYDACYTADQAAALAGLEALAEPGTAAVLEADRGRGKSSAVGLAAGCFAANGEDVLVTAPSFGNAAEVFARAAALLETLEGRDRSDGASADRRLESDAGGRVRFLRPPDAVEEAAAAELVVVDEAAALPVSLLESLLVADRIAFATTIHGYEGAGRGFSVRFRDRLAESDHAVTELALAEPIRYAAGDPIETWAFHALALDARPAVEPVVTAATPDTATYRRLTPEALLADEHLLAETFGLLVLAHYRTEPDDLARLLDAPNLAVRALVHDGHVVSVALLAREGGLPPASRAMMYEGGRIRGNMLPDVLTSQLRDEAAGEPTGLRVMRIATHHAVRSRGLGSALLERIREEVADDVDWLGTGFGATPELLEFWRENGYATVHVSTTRNDASGEYSALMLNPTSEAGRDLHDRHARWFLRRFPAVASDSLADLEPDVARALLTSVDATPPCSLSDHEWRVVAGAAYGPGLLDVDPGPFCRLVVRYLVDAPGNLSDREERLLVLRVLQGRPWSAVADELEYPSAGQCMRALGEALCPLVDRYGSEAALEVRDRFR